jgi:hypothetical protein
MKVTAQVGQAVKIEYLSSNGKPVVWHSIDLMDETRNTVLIQGRALDNGYLGLRVFLDDDMIYPRKRAKAIYKGQVVSIQIFGVGCSNTREVFSCSEVDRAKILVQKYRKAMMFSVNAEYIESLKGKIALLTDEHGMDILG